MSPQKNQSEEGARLLPHVLKEVYPPPPSTRDREAFVPDGVVGRVGIDLNAADQLALLAEWKTEPFRQLFDSLRQNPAINTQRAGQGILHNGYFPTPDAEAYAAMIATRRPARIVEVGAGFSTLVARSTCSALGLNTKITIVDPAPRTEVRAAVDRAILLPIEQVPAEDIALEAGDLLFVDSSHICRTRGDLPYLFCQVLPALPPGVTVQIHDIFLPYDYPNNYDDRMYTEQYMLHCLLSHSRRYRTLLAMHWLSREHGDEVRAVFGPSVGKDPWHYGASYWLEVVG